MNGYLLQEKTFTAGVETFVECDSTANNFGVVFEDDGVTGYFYAVEKREGEALKILDALHIYESDQLEEEAKEIKLQILWSKDWLKCALVINGFCHALFDFEKQGGYNINVFPPLNETWTKEGRELTNEVIRASF